MAQARGMICVRVFIEISVHAYCGRFCDFKKNADPPTTSTSEVAMGSSR